MGYTHENTKRMHRMDRETAGGSLIRRDATKTEGRRVANRRFNRSEAEMAGAAASITSL